MRFNGRRRTVLLVLTGITVLIAIAVGVTVGIAIASVRNVGEISRSSETESALPSVLIDRNGEQITELFGDEKRTLVSIEDLPRHVVHALLTREDRAFFQHNGFNLVMMGRAAANIVLDYLTGGGTGYFSGGSTITQQLAKMMYTDQSVTIARKIEELWWALQLERHYTKFEILEEYLNRMPFGHGTYGIEAASQFYFGHSATDLTVAESVLLILQLSSPGNLTYSPITNPENASSLQREILDQMVELGYVTPEDADVSYQEYWANHDYTRTANTAAFLERLENDPAPWFTEHVRIRLQDELLLGSANIYSDGYRVHTTLDLDYQKAAQRHLWEGIRGANATYRRNQEDNEERIDRFVPMVEMLSLGFGIDEMKVGTRHDEERAEVYFRERLTPVLDMVSMLFDDSEQDAMRQVANAAYLEAREALERNKVEGALITIENDTGHILAMVGGSPFESGNQNNRALNASRPPGSSFKPLYYAAAIDQRVITPATVFMDSPVVFFYDDGTPYTPNNYRGEWRGPTRARYALATSMNVVSLKVLETIGFTDGLGTAARLLGLNETEMAERGFEPRYPVGLGTVSVSPLLMAKAFATFPNGGREVVPTTIRYIEDRRGNTILSPYQDVQEELVRKGRNAQIISPQAAYIMTDMLQSTVEYGTLANRRRLVGGFGDMPMAGKTGTTQNWSDAWTVGFSPYMTTAVWLGFDRGGSNSLGTNQTGAQAAGPIWAWYMKEIHEDLPPREFERPNGILEVTVTAESGRLPTEDYRGTTIEEVFIAGTEPSEFDTNQRFHDERKERLATQLTRPTAATAGLGVRDRLFSSGVLDTSEPDDETTTSSPFGSGANPFFSGSDDSEEDRSEVERDEPRFDPFRGGSSGDAPGSAGDAAGGNERSGGRSSSQQSGAQQSGARQTGDVPGETAETDEPDGTDEPAGEPADRSDVPAGDDETTESGDGAADETTENSDDEPPAANPMLD
ncbi:MAG: PBP1A family penicillin-binding protein [Spirochaetota bacterium]